MEKNKVTILVSSCDLYEDAWSPFVQLLRKHWPDCSYPIVISTETKKCPIKGVQTINIPGGGIFSWTARLRYTLQQIQSEYILWFLEDYFLLKPVDVEGFRKGLSILENHADVGLIHYTPVEKNTVNLHHDLEHCYYELPIRKRTLRTRVAISLFRKEYFIKLLYGDENPWQYERESHIRSMFAGYKIYRQNYELYPPTFTYYLDHDIGIGITSKKWLPNTKAKLEENGITDVNYDRLGILDSKTKAEMQKRQNDLRQVGAREYIYQHFTHPIKRKVRHWWLLQDVLNAKKYFKYWKYYKKLI